MSRRHPKRPLYLSYRVFQTEKDTGDCQDNYFPKKSYGRKRLSHPTYFGILDGVSQSYNSRSWTDAILTSFQKHGFRFWNSLPHTAEMWMEEQEKRISITFPVEFIQSLHRKCLDKVGGATTLAFLQISPSGHFSVEGVGDSCMLLIRNGRVILQTPVVQVFGNSPEQVSSLYPFFNRKAVQKASGNLQKGDTVLLMSDALCEWAMESLYRLDVLRRSSEQELLELVRNAQELTQMKVDDITYMEICIW